MPATDDGREYGFHIIVKLRANWVDSEPDNYDLVERVANHVAPAKHADTRRDASASDAQDRDVWRRLSQLVPSPRFEQILTRERHEELRSRLAAVGRPLGLRCYLTLAYPFGMAPFELISLLKQLSLVEDAYVDPKAEDPTIALCPTTIVAPPLDPLFFQQDYLGAAPLGIDALCVREHWPDGTATEPGAGVSLVDVEQGWKLDHEDLPAGVSVTGNNRESSWPHGTAVLGAICAVPNALGGVGIAPGTQVSAVSHWLRSKEEAIVDAILMLGMGDILLLELTVLPTCIYNPSPDPAIPGPEQRSDIPLPAEASASIRVLIQDAIALGIIVVEAAGNASVSLDTVFDLTNTPVFAADTGAIIVAAAHGGVPHARLKASNFGSVVSCYAWGEDVVTCWHDPQCPTRLYTNSFRNTSAAAALIAGAAAAVQSFALRRTGAALDPTSLRELLVTGGTPSALPGVDGIGVMPDLRQAVTALCSVIHVRGVFGPSEVVPRPRNVLLEP
jgi:hypothetical protein